MLVAVMLFSSILVQLQGKLRADQRLFVIVIFLLHALYTLGDLFIVTGAILVFPHLAGLQLPLNTLLGPAIYFYARAMMAGKPAWVTRKDAWALLGPIAVAAALVPFALLDEQSKLALADPASRDPALFSQAVLICAFAFAIFLAFLYIYLYAALRRQRRHRREMQKHFSNLNQRSLDWLRLMLIILAIGWAWSAFSSVWQISGSRPEWVGIITSLLQLGFTSAFALCALLQPPIQLPASTGEATTSYSNSALTADHMARVAEKLQQAMTEDRLFEDSRLSLRQLSDHTGVSENYISETFSRHMRTSFFDFVNGCRVAKAGELLRTTDHTVLDIAYHTGFNSRSTFNAAFKKHTGMTPRQFRGQEH